MFIILKKTVFFLCITLFGAGTLYASTAKELFVQGDEPDPVEVYLRFSYPGAGQTMITGVDKNGRILLPVSKLFSLLLIPHEVDLNQNLITGEIPSSGNSFMFDFSSLNARSALGAEKLRPDNIHSGETDLFMAPELFEHFLDLGFTISIRSMMLRLNTTESLPVVERRNRMQRQQFATPAHELPQQQEYYAGRERSLLDGGVLDYMLSSNINTERLNTYNYMVRGGVELLGGDMQGTIRGSAAGNNHTYQTSDVRWRYAMPDNPWLRSVSLGQSRMSSGFQNRSFTGIQLSNQPLTSRRNFSTYFLDGTTEPGSEVEVLLNQRLISYQLMDDTDVYSIPIPLSYGTNSVQINTYSPDGSIIETGQRIQIPFNYLPPGEFNYRVSAGMLDDYLPLNEKHSPTGEGIVAYGVNSFLTAEAGARYVDNLSYDPLLVYGAVSARARSSHLFRLEAAPGYYYEANSSAFYTNDIRWSLNYIHFEKSSLYNRFGDDFRADGNISFPIRIREIPGGLRLRVHHNNQGGFSQTRYSTDANLRVHRFNVQLGYRSAIFNTGNRLFTSGSATQASVSYRFRRSARLSLFRGMNLRGFVQQNHSSSTIDQVSLQASKSFSRSGRFNVQIRHLPVRNLTTIEGGLTLNFNRLIASSNTVVNRDNTSFRQSVRGSVNLDRPNGNVYLSNRNHASGAAVSVRMFADITGSGSFDEAEGDYLIEDQAIQLRRGGTVRRNVNGITRIDGLQAYRGYELEVNKNAIRNPSLMPVSTEVSFFTDPNQTKRIDIPFYAAGVIEGIVEREISGVVQAVGGVSLTISQTDGDFTKTIRSLSGGVFYDMEIPPGNHIISVDREYLRSMNLKAFPEQTTFEIRRTTDGVIIEDLYFLLTSAEDAE